MGFENRTTCCMCPPPLSPPRPLLPESTRPPLDTRADSFPRERWLQTVPNVFPDIEQKYRLHAGKERICGKDESKRSALRNINDPAVFPVTIYLYINTTFVKRINYGFAPAHAFVRGIPGRYNSIKDISKTSKELRYLPRVSFELVWIRMENTYVSIVLYAYLP